MWISDEYYQELLMVLEQFASHSFDFKEKRLQYFKDKKYQKITEQLLNIKHNSQQQIKQAVDMMQSIQDGSYQLVDNVDIKNNDYEIVYRKYNSVAKHLDRINRHINRLKKAITENGKIDSRLDTDELEGKWFEIISNFNLILESLSTPVDEITTVINNVAKGNLTTKMRLKIDNFEISGDFLNLAITINTMVDQLSLFASEVTRVAKEVGTDGLLGGQAKVEGVSGTWLDLTNNVNGMADSLTAQVRNIADVTTAVANGNLTQKITVDAKGEIQELKGTINTMVDQLVLFASEVTRVAKEVGTDGLLGGQAKVDGVSGTWLDLTNNVNGMANSLTAQVRNIADVTTAVANGNLTQKITVDAKGEIQELKGTINTMVDQLALFASEVTRVAKEVGTDGLLGGQAKVDGVSGTWLDLTNNVNGMADSLTAQVRNIADVTTAVANGNLTQKITVDAKGEIQELKGTINTMVDQLALFASEVTRVAKEVGTDGLLGGQAKVDGVSGTWLDLTNNVNGMADSLTAQVRNIADVTTAVANGNLTQKITVDAKGEIQELKGTINTMVDQLALFASEVTRVAKEVGTDGLLGGQAKVKGVSGTWLDLTNNVNGMANSLTAQVRNIADVTTAVANGNLTQKITVDAKGEIQELKGTINTMVDQLALFASEVTRVAKEVGTDGLLGGQAEVEGVSGTWLDLTNNVNGMANSLTAQVRNIADVTTAVANGNLTQKITVDAKGEIQELKGTINTMVDQLALFASEVTRVAKEVGTDGLLGGQAKVDGVSGTWLDLTNNVNGMADSLTAQVRNIADVTTAVANGNLTQKITIDAKGEILELKGTINTMVDQLSLFASEVTRVAKEVGTDGLLGGQAEVEGVSGTWLDLTNNVNGMANSLTAQVRNIADVTTAVAKGSLTQKITIDAKGEILELKGTINTMVDQLSLFSSEVTRVAKEVGTDGLLGGQAKVEGVSGTWLDLTNNVNGMADSLTDQVRSIKEVAMAVASGDLTREIDINAKGEFLELKNNINTMINVLSNSDTENKNQNWIKDGVSILNKVVLDKDKLSDQVKTAITKLSRYVNAGMGALYIYNANDKVLKLEGSYAYVKRASISNEFKVGEGIVGQVAYEKQPILLTNVTDNIEINSATTRNKALNTYTSPLIFKDELIGVIEIASYEPFNKVQLEYVESTLTILSGSLYASLQAKATNNLLVQSQTQSEELEKQSIRLKQQNEELENQRLAIDKQKNELEVKNEDLQAVQVEVNKRAKELEDASRYKSEFLANMSHELRTPLNSMLLLSNTLATSKKLDLEKVNKHAAIIHGAGNSLLNLINDILDLSKIEAKLMTLNIEKVDAKELVEELHQLFSPQAENKQIELKKTISQHSLTSFVTDKTKLTQIIKNFLSNAIKFTDEHGIVELKIEANTEADKDTRALKLSVTDSGIGIEKEKIDFIFEAFRQADGSTSRKYGGTGLGLSISKEFAGLLGGRIAVTSDVGKGSEFALFIPSKIDTQTLDEKLIENLDDTPQQETQKQHTQNQVTPLVKASKAPATDSNPIAQESDAPLKGEPKKAEINCKKDEIQQGDTVILVVEDDKLFSSIIVDEVHRLGYKAIATYDGNSAISLAREYKPKAILLDLMLPILDGIEVLRVLKADIETRHIPIKILSFSEDNSLTKKLGAVDFIKKPLSTDNLDLSIASLVDFANKDRKTLLIIEGKDGGLNKLLADKHIDIILEKDNKTGLKRAIKDDKKIDCIIINTSISNDNVISFIEDAKQQDISKPIIIYAEHDFTPQALFDFKKHAGSVVLKTVTSHAKLIEETSLFLHTVKDSLNEEKQELLEDALDNDELLSAKKVLLVDDDIKNIYALSSILELKDIEIVSAENGQEALSILQDEKHQFDIILMDIMMPVMNGYEAMEAIRKIDKFKNLPIIALTAKAQKEDRQKCIDAGANDYMAKPINQDKLLRLLKIWTKRED